MSPEYGATCGIFPVSKVTLDYLRMTGRSEKQIRLVEAYCKEQGLFHTAAPRKPSIRKSSSSILARWNRVWLGRAARRTALPSPGQRRHLSRRFPRSLDRAAARFRRKVAPAQVERFEGEVGTPRGSHRKCSFARGGEEHGR